MNKIDVISAENFIKFATRPIRENPTTQNPVLVDKIKQMISIMSEVNGYYKTWEVYDYQNDGFDAIRLTANSLIGVARTILIIPTFGLVESAIKNECIKTAYKTMQFVSDHEHETTFHETSPLAKKMMDTVFTISYFWRLITLPTYLEVSRFNFDPLEGTIEDCKAFLEYLGQIGKLGYVKHSVDFKLQPIFWDIAEVTVVPNSLHFKKALPPRYVYKSENPPPKPSSFLHQVGSYAIMPGVFNNKNIITQLRANLDQDKNFKYERFTIEVDGVNIDAMLMIHSDEDRSRWYIPSVGNQESYEILPYMADTEDILQKLNANAILFNYPNVGSSGGQVTKEMLATVYKAVLSYAEEKLQAKVIIGYGHSIGGAVQGLGLVNYPFKQDIKYVFVKSRTFSKLSEQASNMKLFGMKFPILGSLIKWADWEIETDENSKNLLQPEIILQTGNVQTARVLSDIRDLTDDGIIPKVASLASSLLNSSLENKKFIVIPEGHNRGYNQDTRKLLVQNIQEFLGENNAEDTESVLSEFGYDCSDEEDLG